MADRTSTLDEWCEDVLLCGELAVSSSCQAADESLAVDASPPFFGSCVPPDECGLGVGDPRGSTGLTAATLPVVGKANMVGCPPLSCSSLCFITEEAVRRRPWVRCNLSKRKARRRVPIRARPPTTLPTMVPIGASFTDLSVIDGIDGADDGAEVGEDAEAGTMEEVNDGAEVLMLLSCVEDTKSEVGGVKLRLAL